MYDDAFIAVSADHGEEMFEHGGVQHGALGLYEEVTTVPLLVKLPSSQIKTSRGTKIDDLVEHIDLYPTIVASLGIPASTSVEGENLFTVKRDWALSEWKVDEWHWHRWGLRTAQYRLMFGVHSDGSPGEITLLFDLISDPLEQKNIAAERPEVVDELQKLAKRIAP